MREYITQKLTQLGTSFSQSRSWKYLKKHHPKSHGFIKGRITLKDFSGLPFTLLIITIGANLLLLTKFTQKVINEKAFIDMDNAVARKLFAIRTDAVVNFFYWFTQIGRVEVVTFLVIAVIIISWWRKSTHFIIPVLVSVLGSSFSMFLGKRIFKVMRPHELSFYQIDNYSFPSGHSAIAVAFYGLLFYFFIRHNYSFKIRITLITAAAVFILLIGFSRLYLCVHYLSDVLAGFLLGGLWLLLSISILEWEQYLRLKKKPVNYL
jgi:undecaprenyl-diphosphatase